MYNGNMQILIYENVNYTKVGSIQSIFISTDRRNSYV